jgi:hypothetical protein
LPAPIAAGMPIATLEKAPLSTCATPFRDRRVVPSPKGDLVSVGFFSRHSRAGLWIVPSLPGLVCGEDLWADGTGGLLEVVEKQPTLQF